MIDCHHNCRVEKLVGAYFWLALASVFMAVRGVGFAREPTISSGAWLLFWIAFAIYDLRRVIVYRSALSDGTCPRKAGIE